MEVPTLEILTKNFGDYVDLFYLLPDKSIPKPNKAKKFWSAEEEKTYKGWNIHVCKICNASVSGGAGSGWTNLSNLSN